MTADNEALVKAWATIENYFLCLTFDGSPESSAFPWTAIPEREGFQHLVGHGSTPVEAVQDFIKELKKQRYINDEKHLHFT